MSALNQYDELVGLIGDFEPGTVSLVGTGPGDSALISVRGVIRLMQADVVVHDEFVSPELLALVRPGVQRIAVGNQNSEHTYTQEQIDEALVKHAKAGRRVLRLISSDPFVFGPEAEQCAYLAAAGVRYEVVPGINTALGAAVTAGIPLIHRGLSRSFTLVTDCTDSDVSAQLDFQALIRMETIALYTGVDNLAANCDKLIAAGLDIRTPVAVISWGTSPRQRTIVGTVADIADRVAAEQIEPPVVMLIGQVVRLRENIEWFETRPLFGQTIAVTRMRDQAASLSGHLRALGAEVIEAPTIELDQVENYQAIDRALRVIDSAAVYDWLVLTSANGVDALFARIKAIDGDSRLLADKKIAAIGSATAERLSHYGIRADLVPPEAVGESMADALIRQGVRGKRILLLRGDLAREQLVVALCEAGAACDDLVIYRTVRAKTLPEHFLRRYDRNEIDWITLTSPSSFVNLLSLLGLRGKESLSAVKLASIGPVTTQAIRDAGLIEAVEADPHNVQGLVSAIRAAASKR